MTQRISEDERRALLVDLTLESTAFAAAGLATWAVFRSTPSDGGALLLGGLGVLIAVVTGVKFLRLRPLRTESAAGVVALTGHPSGDPLADQRALQLLERRSRDSVGALLGSCVLVATTTFTGSMSPGGSPLWSLAVVPLLVALAWRVSVRRAGRRAGVLRAAIVTQAGRGLSHRP